MINLKWMWLAGLVIALDQATKALVVSSFKLHEVLPLFPGLNLVRAHNYGAAFSLLADAGGWQRWLFSALAVGVAGFLIVWLLQLPRGKRWLPIALVLILGGALGNLWDRLVHGYVVDFVDVYISATRHWPAFNVADSAICIGVAMLVVSILRGEA